MLVDYLLNHFLPHTLTKFPLLPLTPEESFQVYQIRLRKVALAIELVNSGSKSLFLLCEKLGTYFPFEYRDQVVINTFCPNVALDYISNFSEKVIAVRNRNLLPNIITVKDIQNGYLLGYLTPYQDPIWDEYQRNPEEYQLYYLSYDIVSPRDNSSQIQEPQLFAEIVVVKKDGPESCHSESSFGCSFGRLPSSENNSTLGVQVPLFLRDHQPIKGFLGLGRNRSSWTMPLFNLTVNCIPIETLDSATSDFYFSWLEQE